VAVVTRTGTLKRLQVMASQSRALNRKAVAGVRLMSLKVIGAGGLAGAEETLGGLRAARWAEAQIGAATKHGPPMTEEFPPKPGWVKVTGRVVERFGLGGKNWPVTSTGLPAGTEGRVVAIVGRVKVGWDGD
jgi:hypothetical protein